MKVVVPAFIWGIERGFLFFVANAEKDIHGRQKTSPTDISLFSGGFHLAPFVQYVRITRYSLAGCVFKLIAGVSIQ